LEKAKVLELYSNAKINLGLSILNKREDGFHNLYSLFLPITLYDILYFEPSSKVIVESNIGDIVPQEMNLCFKAAMALKKATGTKDGVRIVCKKEIPLGAGLGGGSSNAAFTLLGLRTFWNLDISDADLLAIAETLGSDVPFFIKNTPSIVQGKGDILTETPIKVFPYSVLVVNPGIHSNTALAFKKLERTSTFFQSKIDYSLLFSKNVFDLQNSIDEIVNDFEILLQKEYPILVEIKSTMLSFGADLSIMTGSGSTMIGLFSKEMKTDSLETAYQYFKNIYTSTYKVDCIL